MGQRVICCQVVASYITGDGVVAGAVGSHAGTVIEMDFTDAGPEWQDTVRSVTFTDALNQNPVKLLLTPFLVTGQTDVYHIPVPQAAMAVAGTMGMSATGVILDGEEELIRVSTELARFRVLPNEYVLWEDADVPASAAEQLQGEIDGILDGSSIDSFGEVETALAGIQDGTDIDSFADVETALGNIQNGVTLDSFGDVETKFSGILDGTSIDSFGDVEDALDDYLPLAGGTMLGNLNMGLNKITNLLVPYADNDAATKKYVDDSYVTAGQKAGTTLGTKATAEGYVTTASGDVSHAEGYSTEATDDYAHAEGLGTKASGYASHAEGTDSVASGADAHAEGDSTAASGLFSHAEGHDTKATHKAQHVFGEYNAQDPSPYTGTSRGNYVEIVGNGSGANSRSNARTLDWSGNETLAGKLTLGAGPTNNMDAATKGYVDGAVGAPELFWCEYGVTTYAEITAALAAGKLPVCVDGDAVYVYAEKVTVSLDYRTGYFFYSFSTYAEGDDPQAYLTELQCDPYEGWMEPLTVPLSGGGGGGSYLPLSGGTMTGAIAMGSNKITGVGTPTANGDAATKQYVDTGLSGKQNTLTFDNAPTADSQNPVKSGGVKSALDGKQDKVPIAAGAGWDALVENKAEGNSAIGDYSHAEGESTHAIGRASHAEGFGTTANGAYSHAEGNLAAANGLNSHAEGEQTRATHLDQHVFGAYNAADPSSNAATAKGNYVEIVGNGTADNARSNARTLDWSGNEVLAGKLTLGAGPSSSMDAATKEYVQQEIAGLANALVFKGVINAGTDLPATHKVGWTYKVGTAGTYAGVTCEVGDTIVCVADGTAASNADWYVLQANIDGAVTGPASAVDARVAVFDGTTGKILKDGGYTVSDIRSGKEDTSNKVTSLSSASTDTQYPSAKCVYDLIGDVETLLAAI